MNKQAFINGFIKRASQHGISKDDATFLFKEAVEWDKLLQEPSTIGALGGAGVGAGLGLTAEKNKGRKAILGGLAGAGLGYVGGNAYELANQGIDIAKLNRLTSGQQYDPDQIAHISSGVDNLDSGSIGAYYTDQRRSADDLIKYVNEANTKNSQPPSLSKGWDFINRNIIGHK